MGWGGSRANSRITDLNFLRVAFSLFKNQLGRTPWVTDLQRREIQDNWLIFKDYVLQTREQSISMKQSQAKVQEPAWMNSEILTKSKHKKEWFKRWKQGQIHQEEYRGTVQAWRDEVGKATAQLTWNLVKDVQGNKKVFYRSISSKRKTRKYVIPLLNWVRNLVIKHKEKTLSLPQSFLVRSDFRFFMRPVHETCVKVWSKKTLRGGG